MRRPRPRRSCSRRSRFLDLSGEDIRRRMYLVNDPAGGELMPAPRSHHSGRARDLSRLAAGRPAGEFLLSSVRSSARREDGPAEFLQGRNRILRARPIRRRPTPRRLALRPRGDRALRPSPGPTSAWATSRLFSGFHRGRSTLAPAWKRRLAKDFNHKSHLAHDPRPPGARQKQKRQARIPGRARRARQLRPPRRRMRLVTDLFVDRRHHGGSAAARSAKDRGNRFLEQAELRRRAARCRARRRVLIERFLADRGAIPTRRAAELAARAPPPTPNPGCSGRALDLFESRTGFLAGARDRPTPGAPSASRPPSGAAIDYYTGMVFELHDPSGRGQRRARGRRPVLTACFARLGRRASRCRAVGFAVWIGRADRPRGGSAAPGGAP